MNLSPSRHPAFFAIACLSLLAAWSTPEADVAALDAPRSGALSLGDAMPPTFKAPASFEADCIGHAGAQRALCVYTATRQVGQTTPPPIRTAHSATPSRVAPNPSAVGMLPATKFREDRASLDRSVLVR